MGKRICARLCPYTGRMEGRQTNYTLTQSDARQRLLEGWLPLAEETSRLYGWDLDPAGLETLILRAASSLAQSRTALEARLSLWAAYQRHRAHEDA